MSHLMNWRRCFPLAAWISLALVPPAARAEETAAGIVDHPAKLTFPDLHYSPPDSAKLRHVLPCGTVVFLVEDHELPLVDVTVLVRAGTYADPPGKEGLAALVGSQMRSGGTQKAPPEEFDEELDFLAADVLSSMGPTHGTVSLNCLEKDIERALDLFMDMLRTPGFDESRLSLRKSQQLQELARRNDDTATIERREWERLLRGPDFFTVDRATRKSIESITRDDLLAFHRKHFHPRHFVLAVAGDVTAGDILPRLEKALGDWAKTPPVLEKAPPVPEPSHELRSGVYLVNKPDVNQGRVSLGHLAARRDHPDYHALWLMNHILGGPVFTARLYSRIRSDEGLAYEARSDLQLGVYYPGTFRAYFQTKSESVGKATGLVLAEIDRLRTVKISSEELSAAVSYAVGSFPKAFSTPLSTAGVFAQDELTGRDPSFWRTFQDKVRAVTPEDILRVAGEHVHPEKLVVLVVGNAKDILETAPAGSGSPLDRLAGPAGIQRVPLPDPLTLEYPRE